VEVYSGEFLSTLFTIRVMLLVAFNFLPCLSFVVFFLDAIFFLFIYYVPERRSRTFKHCAEKRSPARVRSSATMALRCLAARYCAALRRCCHYHSIGFAP
jgi:hypothetical protein